MKKKELKRQIIILEEDSDHQFNAICDLLDRVKKLEDDNIILYNKYNFLEKEKLNKLFEKQMRNMPMPKFDVDNTRMKD